MSGSCSTPTSTGASASSPGCWSGRCAWCGGRPVASSSSTWSSWPWAAPPWPYRCSWVRSCSPKLLADNTTKDFSSAVPSVVLLAVVLAVASITLIVRNEVQRLLAELVARSSMQQVVDAACRADLARFEDPAFHDRLQRAIVNASIRPLQMTNGLLAVGTAVTGVVAVGVVLLVIDPLFLVLGLIAGDPDHPGQPARWSGPVPLRCRTDPDRPGAYVHPGPAGREGPGQRNPRLRDGMVPAGAVRGALRAPDPGAAPVSSAGEPSRACWAEALRPSFPGESSGC